MVPSFERKTEANVTNDFFYKLRATPGCVDYMAYVVAQAALLKM